MAEKLLALPEYPTSDCCYDAFRVLSATHSTCSSFLESFVQVRKDRNAKGVPTDSEQDLLRATLVFACSGLDAMIKQLVADALPTVLDANDGENGAAKRFSDFVEKQILNDDKFAAKLISTSITSHSTRDAVLKWFIRKLTADSLQSKDQVFQIASFFDIPTGAVTGNIKQLESAFRARNQIIHEMDIDLTPRNRNRTQRPHYDTVVLVNSIFEVTFSFLKETDKRCVKPDG